MIFKRWLEPVRPFVWIFFSLAVLGYLYLYSFTARHVHQETKKVSDTIIVLGARAYRNGRYNPCLYQRVKHAVDLHTSGFAPTLLFSGGTDTEDGANEAETMREIAISLGASPSAILLETHATSTYENIKYSQQVMEQAGKRSTIIVTEPFHVGRASLVSKKIGLDFSISSATESACWTRWKYASRYMLREPFALVKYKIDNKL